MGVTLYSNIGTSAGTCNVVPSPLWSNVGGSCNVKSLYVSFTKTFDEIALQIRPDKSCLTKKLHSKIWPSEGTYNDVQSPTWRDMVGYCNGKTL